MHRLLGDPRDGAAAVATIRLHRRDDAPSPNLLPLDRRGRPARSDSAYVPATLTIGSARPFSSALHAGTQQRDTFATDTTPRADSATIALGDDATTLSEAADRPLTVCSRERPCYRPR